MNRLRLLRSLSCNCRFVSHFFGRIIAAAFCKYTFQIYAARGKARIVGNCCGKLSCFADYNGAVVVLYTENNTDSAVKVLYIVSVTLLSYAAEI